MITVCSQLMMMTMLERSFIATIRTLPESSCTPCVELSLVGLRLDLHFWVITETNEDPTVLAAGFQTRATRPGLIQLRHTVGLARVGVTMTLLVDYITYYRDYHYRTVVAGDFLGLVQTWCELFFFFHLLNVPSDR